MTDISLEEDFTPIVPDVTSGDGIIRTNEQMKEWAELEGCKFQEAREDELFIDIDNDNQLKIFWENIRMADNLFDIDKRKTSPNTIITESKSGGGHKHIRIKLPKPFSLVERILLQACLGSDLKREMISLKRAMAGEENVNVFFEKK